jgi:hypothetical protein
VENLIGLLKRQCVLNRTSFIELAKEALSFNTLIIFIRCQGKPSHRRTFPIHHGSCADSVGEVFADILDGLVECLSVLFKTKNTERSYDTGDAKVVMVRFEYPVTKGWNVIHAPVDAHLFALVGSFESVKLEDPCEGFLEACT